MLKPRLEILAPSQRRLWDEIRGAIPGGFVLYGGTALALRLGHPASEDFDFFSNQSFLPADLEAQVPFLAGTEVQQGRYEHAVFFHRFRISGSAHRQATKEGTLTGPPRSTREIRVFGED